ncbi:MAG: Periplasmic dipeptide transport protein [Chloroflexi bacterium]|nr:Periplasmic dipeptide transport protein [Chloroflexota bacterium]
MKLIKKLRWQILFIILALIVIGVLLWGGQTESQTVLVPENTPEPVTGGVYAEGVVGSLKRLNPLLAVYNPVDKDAASLLFSSLVRFDSKGLPQPDLAESWGISRDGEVYNFSMRRDAVWHDGAPVTSQDVVFTIELLRSEEFPARSDLKAFWGEVEVQVLDEHNLQFRLPEAFAPFLDYLNFGILPAHLLADLTPAKIVDDEFNIQPVGSGPYQFNTLLTQEGEITGVVLKKFPDYYGEEVYLEEFIFKYYQDALSAWEAYQAEEIQGIAEVTSEILPQALDDPNLNLYTGRLPELSLVFLNLDNPKVPFFQEAEIRHALLSGLNRQKMVDSILNGQGVIADGPIFPKTWAYNDNLNRYDYEPEKAIETLKKAGYTFPAEGGDVRAKTQEGEENILLEFTLLYPDDEEHAAIAKSIQENWADLGVSVSLEALPYPELISEYLDTRLYEAALIDINLSQTPDPDPYPFWHQTQTSGGQNYAMWNDRQASEYLEQARIVVDPNERTRMYLNFQVRFVDQMPALPLFYPMYTYGVSNDVKGVRIGPLFEPADRLVTVSDWYLYSELDQKTTTPEE